ncbi:MAG: hypothetical protein HY979_02150 [Candidatus Magasanikbacteria bacterium]|nr:hypothetical protein [Candidatus Magasanikbacteria bacterium]
MKIFLLTILLSILILPLMTQAAPDIGIGPGGMAGTIATGAGYDKANELSLSQQIGKYIKVALSLSGTIFLVLTVYAGFLWMTASGNEDQVTKAKEIVTRASLGLLITLSAFAITAFVLAATTKSGGGQSNNVGGTGGANCDPNAWFDCWLQGFKNAAQNNPAGVPK